MPYKVRSDLKGKEFGRLTVLDYSHTNKHGQAMWKCQCSCGNQLVAIGSHLKSGHTTSCGCVRSETSAMNSWKHGKRYTRLYRIWEGMLNRCKYPSHASYKYYGARGITVCAEWMNDFVSFHDWAVSHGYSDDLSIDRIDVDGNYCPENCRWATAKEQEMNKRHKERKR